MSHQSRLPSRPSPVPPGTRPSLPWSRRWNRRRRPSTASPRRPSRSGPTPGRGRSARGRTTLPVIDGRPVADVVDAVLAHGPPGDAVRPRWASTGRRGDRAAVPRRRGPARPGSLTRRRDRRRTPWPGPVRPTSSSRRSSRSSRRPCRCCPTCACRGATTGRPRRGRPAATGTTRSRSAPAGSPSSSATPSGTACPPPAR